MAPITDELTSEYISKGWWTTSPLGELFCQTVSRTPEATALVDAPNREDISDGVVRRFTYAQLDARAEQISAALFEFGIRKNDVVAIQLPNISELVEVLLACLRLGAIVSPLTVQYAGHELDYMLGLLEPKALITVTRAKKKRLADAALNICKELDCKLLALGRNIPDGAIDFEACIGKADLAPLRSYVEDNPVSANDITTICWTSGTTGKPKAVPRTHNHWYAIGRVKTVPQDSNFLSTFPFINMAGIGGVLTPWILSGGKLVLHHPFDLQIFLRQIEAEAISFTTAPPAILSRLLKQPETIAQYDLSSLRSVGSGGGALQPWMVVEYEEKYGISISNSFGSNEGVCLLSDAATVPDPNLRATYFPRFGHDEFAWNSPGGEYVQTRLVDPATGQEITEPNRPGELRTKGPTVIDGYFKSDELSRDSFDDQGFYKSGDLFEIAGNDDMIRFYRFCGRLKHLIIRGGMNISPDEISNLVMRHPEVREAQAIAYPDPHLGERVCAVVVPEQAGKEFTVADISAFFKTLDVAMYKHPEKVLIVDELPRNATGKVVIEELRDLLGDDTS